MQQQAIIINEIPALVWGETSQRVYLYIHGQGGSKEEASILADVVCTQGFQVLSIDLPQHGARQNSADITFDPWHAIPELQRVMSYAQSRWKTISLCANSIGAWFSMLSFTAASLDQCLFVSPVVDMQALVAKMMVWANVSEAQLEREQTIETDFGQTLSWEYWNFIREHPITAWAFPTAILYGAQDNLVDQDWVEAFAHKHKCSLTVMADGEHWFHTDAQLKFMTAWIKQTISND